ncbi:hypothetical protein [Pseudoalteromonas umbrosa]|nr:hypothetical protein [Pseudoalteromonas sp. B95]MDK1285833.1 hypothetical protein [Pseudoalteromonas sp. B95]
MKLQLKKKKIINLSEQQTLDSKATIQIGGAGFTSSWFKELSKAYCNISN